MSEFEDKCPVCGSPDFDFDGTDDSGDLRINKCYCDECSAEWEDVWAFVENRNVVDKRLDS